MKSSSQRSGGILVHPGDGRDKVLSFVLSHINIGDFS